MILKIILVAIIGILIVCDYLTFNICNSIIDYVRSILNKVIEK